MQAVGRLLYCSVAVCADLQKSKATEPDQNPCFQYSSFGTPALCCAVLYVQIIEKSKATEPDEEGCLSFPRIYADVEVGGWGGGGGWH